MDQQCCDCDTFMLRDKDNSREPLAELYAS